MALFKILKGNSATIPAKLHEGWCYFTTDEGKFYIDIMGAEGDGLTTATNPEGRIALNSAKADYVNHMISWGYTTTTSAAATTKSLAWNTTSYGPAPTQAEREKSIIAVNLTKGSTVANGTFSFGGGVSQSFFIGTRLPAFSTAFFTFDSEFSTWYLIGVIDGYTYGNFITQAAEDADYPLLLSASSTNNSFIDKNVFTPQITANTAQGTITANKFIGTADVSTKMGTDANTLFNVGDTSTPVYFQNGVPVACEEVSGGDFLPLTAGEDYKLTGPLGLTEGVMYGAEIPEGMFEGQLFFVEEEEPGPSLPAGGSAGQALVKNSDTEGDASWQDIVALPKGGAQGQILTKSSSTDGDAAWQNFPSLNYLPLSGGAMTGRITGIYGTPAASIGNMYTTAAIQIRENNAVGNAQSDILYAPTLGFHWSGKVACNLSLHSDGALYLYNNSGNLSTFKAGSVHGAIWNDYAEYRDQKELIKPGYCVASADNGQVYKTTEKFQACDGIVSDTFGFAIGETDECKTPLAVAGRVLAYCEGNRYDYHAGDTVCAGPDGKIVKMSREEIREWPDRIIGIVSEIPEYETWGTGNVLVDGRIWIKVK